VEGRFVEEDVLYRRTFCMGGRFVEGRFVVVPRIHRGVDFLVYFEQASE
jgi:hypothetical protein